MGMIRFLVLVLLYFYAVANVNDALLSFGLYVAVPSAFVLSFFCKKDNIFNNTYVILFCAFLAWIILTWLVAENHEIATANMQRLVGVFMMTIAVCNMATDKRNTSWLYGLYVFVFCTALYYAYTNIFTLQFDISSNRLDDERLNANILANYTFYATFALFVMGEIIKKRSISRIFRFLFILMIPLSYIIALFTASRQVLLVQVPLIAILLYFRYLKNTSFKIKFAFIVGTVICMAVLSDMIVKSYDNSFLKGRYEKSIVEDGRFKVLQEAMEVGCEKPIFGVGPGNFIMYSSNHIFSHCSYTEAFANHGIIGAIIYISLIIFFIKTQCQYYKAKKETLHLVYLTFGLIFALYNFLYVFYSDIWLMSFFMFIAVNSNAGCESEDISNIKTSSSNQILSKHG